MKFLDFLPYLLSLATFIWGVWQFVINKKSKNKERKFDTYIKVSELVNFYQNEIDTFILLLKPNVYSLLLEKISHLNALQAKYKSDLIVVRSNIQMLHDQIEKSETELQQNKLVTTAGGFVEDYTSKIEKFKSEINYWGERLETSKLNTNELEILLKSIDNERVVEEEKVRNGIVALAEKLNQYLLGFNRINDLHLVASDNVILQSKLLKDKALGLKLKFDDLLARQFIPESIMNIIGSNEWRELKKNNELLVELMKKEL